MSFTYSSAKTIAETWFEETFTDAQILVWGNEFIQKYVKDKLWPDDTEEFTAVEADVWQDLPPSFIRTVDNEAVMDQAADLEYTGWEIRNNKIKFDDDGTYDLTYISYPGRLAAITDPVELPDVFEYALAEFFIFRYFNIELDDEDSKKAAMEYEQRFRNTLKETYAQIELDSEGDSFQVQMKW